MSTYDKTGTNLKTKMKEREILALFAQNPKSVHPPLWDLLKLDPPGHDNTYVFVKISNTTGLVTRRDVENSQ